MSLVKLPSLDYPSIRWLVYVFLGGSFNYMTIQYFADFYNNLETGGLTGLSYVIIAGIVVFITPIILALVLTKYHPEKQIIPPMFIQLVALGLFFAFASTQVTVVEGETFFLRIFYTLMGGFFQDGVVLGVLGRLAHREDLLAFSFDVKSDVPRLQATFLRERYRKNLVLSKKIRKNGQNIILRSRKDSSNQMVIELTELSQKTSRINVVIFERGYYALKRTGELEEFAHRQIVYLKEILDRESIEAKELPLTEAESFLCSILDEMKGYSIQIERMSQYGWLKILAVKSIINLFP